MFNLPLSLMGQLPRKMIFIERYVKLAYQRRKITKLIVAGDFNAITSVVLKNSFFNGTSIIEDKPCNDNGSRLKQL